MSRKELEEWTDDDACGWAQRDDDADECDRDYLHPHPLRPDRHLRRRNYHHLRCLEQTAFVDKGGVALFGKAANTKFRRRRNIKK